MSKKTDSYKLGLFIIMGCFLFLAVVVILGSGTLFQTTITLETYINESINGLDIGSPVKLRGVSVGRVTVIGFVSQYYPQAREKGYNYVYVECELNEDMLPISHSEKEIEEAAKEQVEKGLRVRPTSMGLTGQLFLEIDYTDPESNPPPPIDWTPEDIYIPSVPSTMSRIESAVTAISKTLTKVDKADIEEMINNIKEVAGHLNAFLSKADAKGIGERVKGILQEGENVLAQIEKLLKDPAVAQILPNANAILKDTRMMTDSTKTDVITAIKHLNQAMSHAANVSATVDKYLNGPDAKKTMKNLDGALANVGSASVDVKAAAAKLNTTISRVNSLIAAQQVNIQSILENIRILTENLKELSGEAKRNPSGILFGAPPAKTDPGR